MVKKRRIQAPEPAAQCFCGPVSAAGLLLQRELAARCNACCSRGIKEGLLRSLRLQRSFDVHDTASTVGMALPYMQRRSPVLEVLVHKRLLFVLVASGLCSVFDTAVCPELRLSYLNAGNHDIIRSILFNPCDESVLAMSCHSTDESFPSQLHCRSVPACRRYFKAGTLYCTAGISICDAVAHPGFVEFDDVAHRALVYNATSMQYKIYDLAKPDYTLLYTIAADGITEVKLSSSHLIIVRRPSNMIQRTSTISSSTALHSASSSQQVNTKPHTSSKVSPALESDSREAECCPDLMMQEVLPFEVMSAVNGQVLAKHELPVREGQAYFEVLELFEDHLLLKQPMRPFSIISVVPFKVTGSSSHESLSQVSSFIFLQHQHLFMTVNYHNLTTWNFRAQPVASFEDHTLWYPSNLDDPRMCLTGDYVVSYCRPKNMQTSLLAANAVGAIHISNVWTGQLVGKIEARQTAEEDADMQELLLLDHDSSSGLLAIEQATRKALTDLTCVLYDESSDTIYTGNQAGMVHHWAPG